MLGVLALLFAGPLFAQTDADSSSTSKGKRARAGSDTLVVVPDSSQQNVVRENAVVNDTPKTAPTPVPIAKEKSKRRQRLDGLTPADPNIALRRSLLLPGWGQIYNRSAWKLPIVYAGFGAIGFFVYDNNRLYQQNRRAVLCLVDTTEAACPGGSVANLDDSFTGLSVNNIISVRDGYRRNRDFSIILGCLWYGLQALDAYIDAHLQPFNVSDDLSMRVKPTFEFRSLMNPSPVLGASLSLRIR